MYTVFLLVIAAFCSVCSGAAIRKPTWCVEDVQAFRKCQSIKESLNGRLNCKLGNAGCRMTIANGLADFAAFDGGSIYRAGKMHGLKVIMSEKLKKLAKTGTKYFGIAVVKKSSKLTYGTLRGAKSCHTGVWRTAGWVIPIGSLLSTGVMPCLGGDIFKSVSSFFQASCASGANSTSFNKHLHGSDKLCAICTGPGDAKCSRTASEPYYGYQGAFKCMKDGAGDVAFIKESIMMALSPAEQAKYKLLCPDDTVKDPKDYMKCNLAASPAHGILTRSDASEYEIANYQALLKEVVSKFGRKGTRGINVFDGYMLSRYAVGLDDVPSDKRSSIEYLGASYANAISKLESCN